MPRFSGGVAVGHAREGTAVSASPSNAPAATPAAAPAAAAVSSTQPLFITSAMTPIFQNNPSFRVWDWDPAPANAADDTLLDYTVYTAALDRNGPQRSTRGVLVFEPLYVEEGREGGERGGERGDVDDLFCVYVSRSSGVSVCMYVCCERRMISSCVYTTISTHLNSRANQQHILSTHPSPFTVPSPASFSGIPQRAPMASVPLAPRHGKTASPSG